MSCEIEVEDSNGRRHIWIRGEIDEDFDAERLKEAFDNHLTFHLEEVTNISSCGIREWITFITQVPCSADIEYEKCSIPVTRQFGMLSNFRGPGVIKSFFAPYFCEQCDEETERLLQVVGSSDPQKSLNPAERVCAECGGLLEFDGVERVYFSFIREMAR
ncbi:MAG: hypothetical protein KTR25_02255 [Myxococcales bacterium]|nr:hypothetical protein [Myxococcales bacterium]